MKELGYGEEYRYAHDEPEAYAAGEDYFPEELEPRRYYEPVPRGLELKIREEARTPGPAGPAEPEETSPMMQIVLAVAAGRCCRLRAAFPHQCLGGRALAAALLPGDAGGESGRLLC